jgi:hypothetical protein
MIVKITKVIQEFTRNGAGYRKVKGISNGKEVTKSVFDNLQDRWELLKEGAEIDFTMEKKGQFWNVIDIKELPSTVKEAIEEGAVVENVQDKPQPKLSSAKDKEGIINRAVALKAAAEIISSSIKAGLIKDKLKETTIELAKKFEKEYLEGE